MSLLDGGSRHSASDLASHLLTYLDLCAARKESAALKCRDPAVETLQERGVQHEKLNIAHLRSKRLSEELPGLGDQTSVLKQLYGGEA